MNMQTKAHKGFTLIELIVAIAIMALLGTIIAFVLSFCYGMYNTSEESTDAHNLAVLTVQEIQNKVKLSQVIVLSSPATLPPVATGSKYIYFDDGILSGSHKNGVVFQEKNGSRQWYGSYTRYKSKVTFKLVKNNVLSVNVKISNKKGVLLDNTTAQIMLLNVHSGLPTSADDTMVQYDDPPRLTASP